MLLNFRAGFAGLREGFEALGCEVIENRWSPPAAELRDAVLCVADFVDCARRLRRTLAHRRALRAAGVPFVALNRDAPWHRGVHRTRFTLIAALSPFDGYAAHAMQEASRFGRRTLYCPNGARESVYRATAEDLAGMRAGNGFRWDVSFVGNIDVQRYPEHRERAAFLDALAGRLKPLGHSVLFRDAAGLSETAQLELLRQSRISLSARVACDAGPEPSWGLPERCYGVPACGGFLLSDRRRHAADDFEPDEWADYADLDDCVSRISGFLAHPEQMRGIAERAHARVMREHLYRHRAARLLDFARDGC